MQADEQDREAMGRIYALSSDCDATQLKLTAVEGYLLSRIDGLTPWRLLREMGGVPAEEADSCVERWVEEGVLDIVGASSSPNNNAADAASEGSAPPRAEQKATAAPASEAAAPPVDAAEVPSGPRTIPPIDEALLDDGLDIDFDVQRRILEFEACLDWPYHELLDVPKGSEPKVVKRAYFKLSKEFHPDRYFRKDIGSHAKRLDRIFKKVLEAHEMLSDPDLCEVENQAVAPPVDAAEVPQTVEQPASGAQPQGDSPATPKPLSKLERLRQRMPFKIDQSALAARRTQAQQIFQAAELSRQQGRMAEAEASLRIAITFDPARAEYKEALGSIRIELAGARATKLLAAPSERMSEAELHEALRLLEEVLLYRPHDPALNERAARVSMQLGDFDAAEGYVETLIERTPEVAAFHSLMGRIHREKNDMDAAIAAFETALKLDENEVDAVRALAALRLGARKVAQGGT